MAAKPTFIVYVPRDNLSEDPGGLVDDEYVPNGTECVKEEALSISENRVYVYWFRLWRIRYARIIGVLTC
jgi:hypothetical protein